MDIKYQKFLRFKSFLCNHHSSKPGHIPDNERLYVADHGNDRISVFQLNGQFCCIIGSGQLSNPYDVTVSGNGHLLVADYNNHCISSFTLDGAYVGKFNDDYRYPVSLTTDMHGFVLVTEDEAECVTVFDQDGVHVCSFTFVCPCGIAVSPVGNIHVASCDNCEVQIF